MSWCIETAAHTVRCALEPVRDILEERVDSAPPSWCERRGWTGFLLGLDDADVSLCEAEGLADRAPSLPGAPESLVSLARSVRQATRLPELLGRGGGSGDGDTRARAAGVVRDLREVRRRKEPQLIGLASVSATMAERALRIVDIGSGSGHFATLAAEVFDRETLGIERNPERVLSACERSQARGGSARFVTIDVVRETFSFSETDLLVGLHACGALGDKLVVEAKSAGCDAALVSCCMQKIDTSVRQPLSRAYEGFTLRREILGLTNLSSLPRGVEVPIETTMAAREARFALLLLLRARGVEVSPGEEMRGQNRRRAHSGLSGIAARALALRGLAPAPLEEIRHFELEARDRFAALRRLSLPRNMLARLVEIAIVLDRAMVLSESGHHVLVGTLFDRAISPRNIALLASRDPSRLPPQERIHASHDRRPLPKFP